MSSVIGNDVLLQRASALVLKLKDRSLMLAVAESCTGGLLAALITDIAGSSDIFDRGFVTYSNAAKAEMLGVPIPLIETHGAVSIEVARAMALGALKNSDAQITLSITGIAGPGGGSESKPVGLVHFCACQAQGSEKAPYCVDHERRFGDISRDQVRFEAVGTALDILDDIINDLI